MVESLSAREPSRLRDLRAWLSRARALPAVLRSRATRRSDGQSGPRDERARRGESGARGARREGPVAQHRSVAAPRRARPGAPVPHARDRRFARPRPSINRPNRKERLVMSGVVDTVVKELAELGWQGFQAINRRVPETPSPQPDWAPRPLLKSHEKTKPPLGWPRSTDSLCPRCVIETRTAIINGERDLADLVDGHVGEIKAHDRRGRGAAQDPQDVPRARGLRGPPLDRSGVHAPRREALPRP